MTDRSATTTWEGGLADGKGQTNLDSSSAGKFDVSWPARAESPQGQTSPEELIAAAHASCYSMALSKEIADAGGTPQRIQTTVTVTFDTGSVAISDVAIKVRGTVEGMDEAGFKEVADGAKHGCPVSKLMAGNVEISLDASLS
jgi:osmotically inducible protein OsmC